MICQAHRTNGEPCKARAVNGRKVCRAHGGLSPQPGPTHPNWKHGRRSKYIPARLAEKYGEAMQDPELMEFRADAALLQSRLAELLETAESAPLWSSTQNAFHKLREAMADGDRLAIGGALTTLESLINRGMSDALRWAEVYRVVEQIGKTKEREHKRLLQAGQMVTSEQLLAILGQIANAARDTITNRDELRAFSRTLGQYGVTDVGTTDRGN